MSSFTTRQFECPVCYRQIAVDYEVVTSSKNRVICDHCNAVYYLDFDADCDDGAWKDLTKLVRV